MADYFKFTIEEREGIKVINISGNISIVTKDEFTRVVSDIIQKGNVIINLKDVEIITSSGLNALINISLESRQKKRRMLLFGMKENIIKSIELLDFFEYFIFVDSIEEGQMKIRYYT